MFNHDPIVKALNVQNSTNSPFDVVGDILEVFVELISHLGFKGTVFLVGAFAIFGVVFGTYSEITRSDVPKGSVTSNSPLASEKEVAPRVQAVAASRRAEPAVSNCDAVIQRAQAQARSTKSADWTFWLEPEERFRCLGMGRSSNAAGSPAAPEPSQQRKCIKFNGELVCE